jgi:diguanylate cyclase (GGDEF)-like protein
VFFSGGAISAISRRILAIYLVMVLVLLSAFGLFVVRQAGDQNEAALASSQALANGAMRAHLQQLRRVTRDNAVWDDAYRHMGTRVDSTWADSIFGPPVWNDLAVKLQGAFVVDGHGITRYGVWEGKRTDRSVIAFGGVAIWSLIDQARRAHGGVSGVVTVAGEPKLISAVAVRPTTVALERPELIRNVLIWLSPMDEEFNAEVAQIYSLRDLHWEADPPADAAQVPLMDIAGGPAGNLVWTQAKPGQALVGRALLPCALLVVLCTMAGIWQARLTMRAAKLLNVEHDRARLASARAELLSEEASRDTLTGLLNRRGLAETGREIHLAARLRTDRIAALVIDLDRFKPVNDSHGHHVGDEVLRRVGQRLLQAVRPGDAVARLGGDEFVILTSPAHRPALEALARRLIETLSFPLRCSIGSISVGASVGVAIAESDEEEIESVIRRADRALFAAKEAGRAQWRLAA